MMAPWWQMMRVWTDSMSRHAAPGIAPVDAIHARRRREGVAAPRVAVQVSSADPVEVKADFDPAADTRAHRRAARLRG